MTTTKREKKNRLSLAIYVDDVCSQGVAHVDDSLLSSDIGALGPWSFLSSYSSSTAVALFIVARL
jgi:hypothetical protein